MKQDKQVRFLLGKDTRESLKYLVETTDKPATVIVNEAILILAKLVKEGKYETTPNIISS